jgi:hypothetical protein
MSQRVVQYQAVIQMAQMAPDIYDMPQLHRRMLEVLGIKNAEKLVKLPEDQKPRDPVTENMAILKGEPVKAFFYQDHDAHIQVHMSMIQDPLIGQMIGQNPRAPAIQAALMAHVAEHVGFKYRLQIEQAIGVPLPPEDAEMPPQVEMALSSMMSRAAQQVLEQSQAQAAQQQAQQQAQDPLIQMQQQQLQIDQQRVQIEQQKVELQKQKQILDAAANADRTNVDKQRVSGQQQLDAMVATADIENDKARLELERQRLAAQQQTEGTRIGVDIARSKAQLGNKP